MAAIYEEFNKDFFLKSFNIKDARKRQNLTQDQIEEFRTIAKGSDIIPKTIDDIQILFFLNSSKDDPLKAVRKLEKFFELKRSAPEFFDNRSYDAVKNILKVGYYVGLPITPDNCNLLAFKLKELNLKNYLFEEGCKAFIMKSEMYSIKNGPRDGAIFLMDFKGLKFQYLFKASKSCISSLIKAIKFGQEASPVDVKQIHVFNTPSFVNYFMAIIRPFVWSEMVARIHFWTGDVDWEKFHEKFVPKSHLPSDYGGDLESMEVLHKKQLEEFKEFEIYFAIEEKHKNCEFDEYLDEFMEKRRQRMGENQLEELQEREKVLQQVT